MMNKKAQNLGDVLALGFGGLFAIATLVTFYLGYTLIGIICIIITFFAWITSFKTAMTIATILALGGFIELVLGSIGSGILWLIISALAFFLPHWL